VKILTQMLYSWNKTIIYWYNKMLLFTVTDIMTHWIWVRNYLKFESIWLLEWCSLTGCQNFRSFNILDYFTIIMIDITASITRDAPPSKSWSHAHRTFFILYTRLLSLNMKEFFHYLFQGWSYDFLIILHFIITK
jgi:hypothetical protein